MHDVANTLKERENRYGDFNGHASISQALKNAMQCTKGWANLNAAQSEALEMIAHKIARILNGDPTYADSWHDIAGYAKLVEDLIERNGSGALKEGKGWIEWTGGDCPVNGSSVEVDKTDGWIKWDGGECPAFLDRRRVRVKFRSGDEAESKAKLLTWWHDNSSCDIVAYRRVSACEV